MILFHSLFVYRNGMDSQQNLISQNTAHHSSDSIVMQKLSFDICQFYDFMMRYNDSYLFTNGKHYYFLDNKYYANHQPVTAVVIKKYFLVRCMIVDFFVLCRGKRISRADFTKKIIR